VWPYFTGTSACETLRIRCGRPDCPHFDEPSDLNWGLVPPDDTIPRHRQSRTRTIRIPVQPAWECYRHSSGHSGGSWPHVRAAVCSTPNQHYIFTWDGKDAYGRSVTGAQDVTVKPGHTYWLGHASASRFGYSGTKLIFGQIRGIAAAGR
jgi:hypothetical protein